ncbi:outer membrane protein assembly factor BamA [Sediminibacter sp. Hel_I_10]|uniref:outer membrane protein assembly factor BamA n=1 Tax=Sediminibacter sp. Hel_I_10 TaxID=1392490 RepID=UPI0005664A26|nr:outer membrane protein assembly factor BamA [Sediminibacter sp. Hel_I_10]
MKTYIQSLLIAVALIFSSVAFAQQSDFNKGKTYILEDVTVTGNTNFSPATIISFSRLKKGEEIVIPGEDISKAIKKLWDSNLFSSIDVYLAKVEGNKAYLEINLFDLPELRDVTIEGIKKGKHESIIKDNGLTKGTKVTENLITTTKNYLTNKYKKDGFLKAKVNVNTREVKDDSIEKSRVDMLVYIDRGEKVKIKEIVFDGNEKISDKKLRKAMKNTKQKNIFRILKRSKYIKQDYKEDLVNVIDKYKENGYRDARVISDSISYIDDKTIALNIKVEEGEQYKFGKITFVGNSVYTDQQLKSVLKINEGTTYNGVELRKRIADDTKPDALDLTNLYQDSGYLFSTINPVEVSAEGNVIDLEIRISEGKPAYFNQVSVSGNDKTNDHVIYRELRTKPGQLYKKSNVIRTIRELGQLGFFDAQQLTPNMKNFNTQDGTVDIEYEVVERGSSQIELQGGYGGGGFIGTLGLSFNNFAIKDIFNKEAYKPIPAGDGQSLALRLQASRFFQTYSFSFSEPWLGGKRPVQFSTSISHTKQFLYNAQTRDADKDKRFNITGISVGIAKRLKVPDDYFQLSQSIGLQHYDLKNYNTGLFTFGNGYSNNLSYTVGLTRNDTRTDPIYPTAGSNFSVSAKLSLPYSLFNSVDYEGLREERNNLDRNIPEEAARVGEIDQEFYKWLEFYKIKFKGDWYTNPIDKLVLKSGLEFGFLGAYNQDRGIIPFERFFLGGDGLGNFSLDGREVIQLRGYPNQSLSSQDGGTIYNKFSLELRYPITLGAQAKIYGLTFAEAGASFDNFRDFNPFNLNRSAGAGIRIFMPAFGLLGIDFGYGFDALPGQTGSNGLETHFIIGQQF